jgi:uncharacterized zinc-type alcohol dehydrogenase-like protein
MGIKLAAALGHEVVAISSSNKKVDIAKDKGAHHYIDTSSTDSINKHNDSIDLILNTISAPHSIQTFLGLLRTNGTLVQLGCVASPMHFINFSLIPQRKSIAGSTVGGLKSLQECVDFCIEKEIYPEIEVIDASKVDEVYINLSSSNVSGVRYVLDIEASL